MPREIGYGRTLWWMNWKAWMGWPFTLTCIVEESNADYWYQRSGRRFYRPTLDAECAALIEELLEADGKA